MSLLRLLLILGALLTVTRTRAATVEVASLAELARAAAGDNQQIKLKPGVYRMADYLTPEVLKEIAAYVNRSLPRPPVPMLVFRGSGNTFDLRDVVIEIDTSLYRVVPQGGYTRSLIIDGNNNRFDGLTLRNTGAQRGSGGNTLSVAGTGNTLENITLHVSGSFPYGYGDLLGKGGPNLVSLQKQSGIQVLGSDTTLRRCKVFSRAFGHCFYIQAGDNIRLENCYAEGAVRSTTAMLTDTAGAAFEQGFRSVYRNRDGRFMIAPGYLKSLSEDGFRTYGGAGSVTLLNCVAVNTRAGFEIGAKDDAATKTVVENCIARGCERAYLIGSHTLVRRSRGDIAHGPLLYLRGGRESEVELELIGDPPAGLVHNIATIAGENHRVLLTTQSSLEKMPALPILVGYGMPGHAEMASATAPAPTRGITVVNKISFAPVITSDTVKDSTIETNSRQLADSDLRKDPGPWGLPPSGIAGDTPAKK